VRMAVKKYKSNRAMSIGRWEEVAVGELKPAARKLRTHPSGKKRSLEASIHEYGILNPIAVDPNNFVVDGNLRLEIAKKLDLTTVPVIRIEHLDEAELLAYGIAANKMPGVANIDFEALGSAFGEIETKIPDFDMRLTGFSYGEVDRIAGRQAASRYDDLDDQENVDPSAPAISAVGQLYALGRHRLICGDSLNASTFEAVMQGEAAACCFTDPPYNVRINGNVSSSGRFAEFAMASGEMSSGEFEAFLTTVLGHVCGHLADGAVTYACMDHAHLGELLAAGDTVFDQRLNICVWDKGVAGMGSFYRSQHELVAVFKKGTATQVNNIALGKHGRNRSNIWNFPGMGGFGKSRKKALKLHPTVKPVALVAEALLDVTGPGDLVLDPFGGSGSTLIAAERTERRACLIEYDPVYVDRTIARWERLTGSKAELIQQVELQKAEQSPGTVIQANNCLDMQEEN